MNSIDMKYRAGTIFQKKKTFLTLLITFLLVTFIFLGSSSLATVWADNNKYIHIVMLEQPPLALYEGGIEGLPPTSTSVTGASRLDIQSPASTAYLNYLSVQHVETILALEQLLGRDVNVPFQYNASINGFAAELTLYEASLALSLPNVVQAEKDYMRYLHTDVGPQWIGAPGIWDGSDTSDGLGTRGEGVVVGVIDSGINTDHPSFAGVGPVDGYVHSNPRGTFFGLCDPLLGTPFCNNKLIGVYDFTGTAPEDDNGHGSHTASTTAGNVVDAALIAPTLTVNRTISGVAPHANIIAYKACVTTPAIGTCPISALIAAINQATLDEVDVINFSIGGRSSDPWSDLDAQAFFGARSAGIFVATSAGNDGPGGATLGSPADAPWVLSVAASTHNRRFVNALVNMSGGSSPPADIQGASVTTSYGPATIVYAGDFGNALCGDGTAEAPINPFAPGTFNGEIVVCDRGTFARVDKARFVGEAGAGGFVLANDIDSGDSLVGDAYAIPGVHIGYGDGVVLKAWLASGSGHTGSITGTAADEDAANGDVMASFSSRGPNPAASDLIKPDITAPGVDILAAFNTTDPLATDPEFGVISGTSMSSPHVAGSGALIRALHPDWTPDEVKSALMTTAFNALPGNISEAHVIYKEDGLTPADPFDRGSGRVDLSQASRAGLVLNETPTNYNAANPGAGGDPKSLNIPSLGNSSCTGTCSWTREVRSTAQTALTWTSATAAPAGMALTVTPSSFTLSPGQTQVIHIEADVNALSGSDWRFAQVTLHPNDTNVPSAHFPVAVIPLGGVVTHPQLALHFQGNLDEGCTGDGRADIVQCDGPFLNENPLLDSNPAAQFGPVAAGVDGTSGRNIYDPNWVWNLSEPTTIEGVMTLEWWASCGACGAGVATADWDIAIWADGVEQFVQRVMATPALPNVPSKLMTSVVLPAISANSTFVLQIDPLYIDSQQNSIIYYDSTDACPGNSEGPCDSIAFMPVVGLATPTPVPTETPEPTETPIPTATNPPPPTETPEPTETPIPTATSEPGEPQGGGFVTGAGWLHTIEGERLNFFVRGRDTHPKDKEATLRVRDDAAGVRIEVPESAPIIAIGHVQEPCGSVRAGSNAIEYHASGTFNGSPADFRVCVEDNNEPGNNANNPDLFYMECLSGCSYNTASRTHDDGLDGGNIKVHDAPAGQASKSAIVGAKMSQYQAGAVSVLALDPLLLSEAPLGALETLTVKAFDAHGELLSGVDVTVVQTLSDGSEQTVSAVTGLDGLAIFTVTIFSGDSEFVAYDGDLTSNAVMITAVP